MEFLTVELGFGAAISGLLLALAPYAFPKPRTESEKLPTTVIELISRYVYGTASLLIGYTIWLLSLENGLPPAQVLYGIFFITTIGGGVVCFRYASAWIRKLWSHEQITMAHDKELQ